MEDKDIAFRRLLRTLPEPLVRLVFGDRPVRVLGPLDASADRARRRTADNLFRALDQGQDSVLHIEIQNRWQRAIPGRAFEYGSGAHVESGLPVASIVVLLRPGGRPPGRRAVYEYGAFGARHGYEYYVLPLYELDAEEMQRVLPPEGWPLCVAMRGGNARLVRRMAVELKERPDIAGERKAVIGELLFMVTAAMLGARRARRIFDMDAIIDSPGVQELFRQLRDEGRAEGRVEGERALLLRLMCARFGEIPEDVVARVEVADIDHLDRWAKRVLTASRLAEVFDPE